MLSKAAVVGAGGMGTVTAQILANNVVNVSLLAQFPDHVDELLAHRENRRYLPGLKLSERIHPTFDANSALAGSELVVSAIPCQYLRRVWREHGGLVPAEAIVVSVTKGIEIDTLERPSQIITEHVGDRPLAVLSGPSVAPELARCLPATVVVASASREIAEFVQGVLSTSWFRIYTNTDVVGVELAGALKNVIALAAGILDGLHAGDNAKAALLTRGLVEITRLGIAVGARPETFAGLAGMGDLVTTCVSPVGRNRSAGERIGAGANVEEVIRDTPAVIEGIPTTRAVLQLAARYGVEMPITRAVHDVLFDGKTPIEAITQLMRRPPKAEDFA